jgi:hypothetical protein
MISPNNQFQNMLGMQKEALEPFRAINSVATDAFERIARENYATLGDVINFAIEQVRLPAKVADVNEYFARQAEFSRGFGEQLLRHTQAYLEIASNFRDQSQAVAATNGIDKDKPARKAA